jgi:hypothetical protein
MCKIGTSNFLEGIKVQVAILHEKKIIKLSYLDNMCREVIK